MGVSGKLDVKKKKSVLELLQERTQTAKSVQLLSTKMIFIRKRFRL